MKRLLRGGGASASASTSLISSHNNAGPIPTKASIETRSMSEGSSTGPTNQQPLLLYNNIGSFKGPTL